MLVCVCACRCADLAYLRSSPTAARTCGYYGVGIAPEDLVRGAIAGACEPAGDPSALPAHQCAFGGGRLGALLALTRCTARIDQFHFTSYEAWRDETASAMGFVVSSRYGVYLPACAFLGNPTDDGLGGYLVRDGPE